jgi:hypothetical protein
MRVRGIAAIASVVIVAVCAGSEPEHVNGLSVHMLPDRVAQIAGGRGGFSVRDAKDTESTYADPNQLAAFFQTLSPATQKNGIWIVTTHPTAYTSAEREKLRVLLEICRQKNISVFTCRGSELPSGWKRSEVPTGGNSSSETG